MAQQQLVEIAKAMSFAPSVLLLDEPTSALAHHEVDRLLTLVRSLARRGTAVIYISHRLQELPQVADVVSVLRDGRSVGTISIGDATPERIVDMMFGQSIHGRRAGVAPPTDRNVLEVRRLSHRGKLADVGFALRRGEILGIAGMLGSGRTELLMSIFGAAAVRLRRDPDRRPSRPPPPSRGDETRRLGADPREPQGARAGCGVERPR